MKKITNKKLENILINLLIWLPFFVVVFYTRINFSYILKVDNIILYSIIEVFNFLYSISPYIYLITALSFGVIAVIRKNKTLTYITVITIVGAAFTYMNSLGIKEFTVNFKVELAFISFYLIGIIYLFLLKDVIKNINIKKIDVILEKVLKAIVIYISIIFLLSIFTDTYFLTYNFFDQGISGWFSASNALGHFLIMTLPVLVYFYFKEKKDDLIIYIFLTITLMLLLGTKATYYAVYGTLVMAISVPIYKYLKTKKMNYKIIPIGLILIIIIVFNNYLFAASNIESSLNSNTYIDYIDGKEKINLGDFVLNHRQYNVLYTNDRFIKSNVLKKAFGFGVYYPKYNYLYVEMDLFDLLYSRGIYGVILYIVLYGYFLIDILRNLLIINKEKHLNKIIFLGISIGLTMLVSFFVGHILFNMMTLSMYIVIINYFNKLIKKEVEKWKKNH